jgi:NADH-quinone oxidoreductase subunit H
MFFMAEYANMITVSCLATIMFFGGWVSPFPATPLWSWTPFLPCVSLAVFGIYLVWDGLHYETTLGKIILPALGAVLCGLAALLAIVPAANSFVQGPFWFLLKVFVFLFLYVWARATLPRFRYDQLMAIGWKLLLPVSILNVVLTSAAVLKWGQR